ncbi:WD40 repeat domain-containing protein [Singulisphaera acidiphila]|uniref:Uncharacterized protein n=1 Tax=Singulisphaera acidiphila (strain ATCC BAA-1392 / DSM 18658 / VKM B-2454 / MOB10) TaxID=886293 RepID=L0DJS2_SINAD|nr:hypothetical protein [Singulisphaera acidiphila]AGA29095.1 hypothetical protein Sinac_4939 [Singulisphaera acidiphila DSM 18658]
MPEITGRQQTRIDPSPAWTVHTEAPLKGMALAREAGTILAWDERGQLYLLDLLGNHRSVSRAPDRVVAGTISDNGAFIALLGEGSRLWFLGADLDLIADRPAPPDATNLAVDPHGRYLAVGSRLSMIQFYNRHGKQAGRLETRHAMAHLVFVPDRPFLLGAATYGMLVGIELEPGSSAGKLAAEVAWEESLMSNVGRLTTTGDGGMILASCFTYGIQRFDFRGGNEGAYHLGGTAAHAVPDFAGRMIAVSTLEGELAVLSSSGGVRWKTMLSRPVIALEADPLGRYLIHGHATGEIVRLDLYGSSRPTMPRTSPEPATATPRPGASPMRTPAWSIPIASTDEQAESAVLTVLDDPARIGLMTNSNRLQIFSSQGENLGQTPELLGFGRILRTAPGWIAAATDRYVMLYNARRSQAQRVDLSMVEITHLAIAPDSYGLGVVQERDRIGRATLSGRWIWKRELASSVEDFAISPDGFTAVTTTDGRLDVFDPAGEPVGGVPGNPADPLFLIEAPEGSPSQVAWVTLARRAQVLRGHDRTGKINWESPVPWEGWQLHRLGAIAMVSAPDGRTLAFDGAGHLRGQSRASDVPHDVFGTDPQGQTLRVSRQGVHLICSDLSGRVNWRAVADQPLGPVAIGRTGVAVLIGRSLAWFPSTKP